jgi:hypothetical protein
MPARASTSELEPAAESAAVVASAFARAPAFAPPRLSHAVARELDRLARRAHAFHRFAHHPLCDRYSGELIRLGKRERVCRGCAAVAGGFVAGAMLNALVAPGAMGLYGLLGLGALLGVMSLRARLPKSLGRFVPALGLGSAVVSVFTKPSSYAWLVAAVVCAGAMFAYRRRGPSRTPCETCPERLLPAPCSGFASIVRRERAFQRVAQRIIARA